MRDFDTFMNNIEILENSEKSRERFSRRAVNVLVLVAIDVVF